MVNLVESRVGFRGKGDDDDQVIGVVVIMVGDCETEMGGSGVVVVF
ncbi:hypothetical protein Hanom_Chr03g00181551 [Helianthus anomalus]